MKVSPRIAFAFFAAVVAAAAAAAVLAATGASGATRSETSLPALDRSVLAAINRYRARHHLHPLRISSALDRSSKQHSLEMGADGYFAHPSANGTAFWRRIERYYPSQRSQYWSVGENLLWASPDVNARHAMRLWIASPEHKANLLAARWRQIGISAVHVVAAPGVFHGLDVTIVTTDFGVRR
ncbi:MAG TPA: CAP domain-containing protein [Gaiellaceae bacterium]|nr:CAP domain-containing protein [Gaiellaceae bacterium]